MGALTLKTFSDELREWEFIEGESIDPTDGFGTDLRLSIRENQIFLAEPNDPDMPWITNRGRLFFDGMFEGENENSDLDWRHFFKEISDLVYFMDQLNIKVSSPSYMLFVFENISLEVLNILYLLNHKSSLVQLRRAEIQTIANDFENRYQLNCSVDKNNLGKSTLAFLVNTNTRQEGYVLNLNLRQRLLKGNFKLFALNSILDLTFPIYNLGSNAKTLKLIGEGTHLICQDFKSSKFPLIVTNTETLKRSDTKNIFKVLKQINVFDRAWNNINVLNSNIAGTGLLSLTNFLPVDNKDLENFFSLHFINVTPSVIPGIKQLLELEVMNHGRTSKLKPNRIVINQNNNNSNKQICLELNENNYDRYFHLPNNLFLEDNETFINTEGIIKRTTKMINFKKQAKKNWQIIRKLYFQLESVSQITNYKDVNLLNFQCENSLNYKNYVHFQYQAVKSLTSLSSYLNQRTKFLKPGITVQSIKANKVKIINTKLKNWLDDFFTMEGKDFYSYNSSVLTNCSKIHRVNSTNFF